MGVRRPPPKSLHTLSQSPDLSRRGSGCGYWISFRDGLQRVVLFTTNKLLSQHILGGNKLERAKLDVSLSIKSVGVSLVNDVLGLEIAYIGIFQ